ncbi:MAG: hypothetical protein NTW70_00390 [Chloroflexi bacterium]|nr:hypothetical protein [Chloroflexota bacterium]
MSTRQRWLRLALPLALIAVATAGAAWSPRLDLPLTTGAWSAPGGVSSGLLLWYDTAETGTMSLAPKLRYWFDKSGQAQHAQVSSGQFQPYPTLASGVAGLQFSGAAVQLPASIPLEPMTLMLVFRQANDGLSHPLVGSSTRFSGISMEFGRLRVYSSGQSVGASTARAATGLTITTVRTATGASDGFQYNGGAETPFSITTTESMNWIGGMFVAGTAKYFVGTIMEVAIWGRSLSASELQAAHRALGAKWGISVP